MTTRMIALAVAAALSAGLAQASPASAQEPVPPVPPVPPPAETPPTPPAAPPPAEPPAPEVPPQPPALKPGAALPIGQAIPALDPGQIVRLSDENAITRWAYGRQRSKIFRGPSGNSGSMGRIRFYSTGGADEIFGVLNATTDKLGRRWLRIRVPYRPNGRTGWVLSTALSPLQVTRTSLVVERRKLRATLYKNGKRVFTTRVGIGRAGTPTPSGSYYVSALVRGSVFGPAYGKYAFLTTAYSSRLDWPGGGLVGVHGTNQPGLVPGRPSNGCIRMRDEAIVKLARLMPIGTPVHIR